MGIELRLRLSRDARREVIRRRARYLSRVELRREARYRWRGVRASRPRVASPWVSLSAQSRMDDAQLLLADVDAGSWERRKR